MKESQEREIIRKYLLGNLENEDARQDIERRLMTEDASEEEISMCQDELIDDYLNGRLNREERGNFENHFLLSPDNREKLEFAHTFKNHLDEQKRVVQKPGGENVFFNWLRQLLRAPLAQTALVVLLICGIGLVGVWYFLSRQSELDAGITAFQQAYQQIRPFESRIVDFNYSPLSQTRGNDENHPDARLRRRAEVNFLEAEAKNRNAASLYWLGKFYLTEKNIDKAIEYFDEAARLDPTDAKLQSDLGAALLEQGKRAATGKDGATSSELFDKSLKHLDEAIRLNPALLEARFNRALCLEAIPLLEQAKQAWREYLDLDSNSKWADEAQQHLVTLEAQKKQERSATELENDFLNAFVKKNEEEAWRLLIGNRELIKEKYLPQRLAMSFLEASGDEKKQFLRALKYAGQLEKNRINDPFASEIAQFYATLSENKHDLLREAQLAVRKGYKLCLESKYTLALNEFTSARDLFSQADDVWEAKLSEYFIAYCLQNNIKVEDSLIILNNLVEFCQRRKYKWFELTALYWVANSYIPLRRHTQAKTNFERALSLAEEINDSYAIQRNLCGLANLKASVGQKNPALNYVQRILEESQSPDNSIRQKYRNYHDIIKVFNSAKLYNLAKEFAIEAVSVADETEDPLLIVNSRNFIGTSYIETNNYDGAQKWLLEALQKAASMTDETAKKRTAALALLRLAALNRRAGDYEKALEYSDQALNLYRTINLSTYLFETYKERLLAYHALKKTAELEEQIPITLKLFEENRANILEAQERISFFETEQAIYDIAIDYNSERNRSEQAYNLAESSSSRSLLDWLQKGGDVFGDVKKPEISLEGNATLLSLTEIRERMPAQVQILQYSVLKNKILIWLVSKERFAVVATEVEADKLNETVKRYSKAISVNDQTKQFEAKQISRELYNLLIKPIINQLDRERAICIIPNKILYHLPFAALQSENGSFFLKEFNLFYAPSANVFLFYTRNAEDKAAKLNETLLSIGNPSFDQQMFDDLSDLPEAEAEAREIADFYEKPQKPLIGRDATKTAFLNSYKNAEIIHFAGHYIVNQSAPLSSGLLLAKSTSDSGESVLTNSELIREKLPRAKLIILSACQTGVENYYKSEGLIGLSRTFLSVGAPIVVASHWKVDSKATFELMKKFHYYRRQEGLSTTAALRKAQLEMLESPYKRFQEPYYWAAFAGFGGYSTF